MPRNDSAGFEVTVSGRAGGTFSYSVSGNPLYAQIDATALGVPGLRSKTGVNGKLKVDFKPTAADALQLGVTRTDRRLTPQGTVSAITIVNFGYKHTLTTRLTAIATAADA